MGSIEKMCELFGRECTASVPRASKSPFSAGFPQAKSLPEKAIPSSFPD